LWDVVLIDLEEMEEGYKETGVVGGGVWIEDLSRQGQNVGRKIVPPASTACRQVRCVKWGANT
jgi:hypothetical protein